jgi:hypothetical protein
VLNAIGKALGPAVVVLVEFIRVIFGVVLTMVGVSLLFSGIFTLLVLFGVFSGNFFGWPGFDSDFYLFPLEVIRNSFPSATVVATSILMVVPALFMVLLGVSVIVKRIVFNAVTGWTLFVALLLSIFTLAVQVPAVVFSFKEEGERITEVLYPIQGTPVLKLQDQAANSYNAVYLRLRGYEGTEIKLVKTITAQGTTRTNALQHADMVRYDVVQEDSVLYFDASVQFNPEAIFRAQRVEVVLYIPYNQPFAIDYSINKYLRNYIYRQGYILRKSDSNLFMLTEDGLECLSCPDKITTQIRERRTSRRSSGKEYRELGTLLKDFREVKVTHPMVVDIRQGEEFRVEFEGKTKDLEDLDVHVEGETLFLQYLTSTSTKWRYTKKREDIRVVIYMPHLQQLDLRGASSASVSGFTQESMQLKVVEASQASVKAKVEKMEVRLKEAARLELSGSAQTMNAHLSEASQLNAYQFKTAEASIEAETASTAKVFVTDFIDIDAQMASTIRYRGGAQVRNNSSSFGNVKAE